MHTSPKQYRNRKCVPGLFMRPCTSVVPPSRVVSRRTAAAEAGAEAAHIDRCDERAGVTIRAIN